jgi:exonuclease SbcC
MNAIIEELEIKNFESYKSEKIKFTEGLNLIKGRNSTGKSTLLDALLFGLYGSIPYVDKRLLVSRLRKGGEMEVCVKFKSPSGSTIKVYRSGKLNIKGGYESTKLKLIVDGREIDIEGDEDLRKKVTEKLGISLKKFINLVYVRQGSLQDILEPEKKVDVDLILRLTLLRELKEQIDEAKKELEKYEGKDVQTELQNIKNFIIPQLKANINGLEQDIESLKIEVSELEELIKKAESLELMELLMHVDKREDLRLDLRDTNNKLQTFFIQAGVNSREELLKLIKKLEDELITLKEQSSKLEEEVKNLHEKWIFYNGKVSAISHEINEHEKLLKKGTQVCPMCGQKLDAKTLKDILERKRSDLETFRREEEILKKDYTKKNDCLEELKKKLNESLSKINSLKELDDKVKNYLTKKREIENKIIESNKLIEAYLKDLSLPFDVEDPELKLKLAQQLPLESKQLKAKKKELEIKNERLNAKIKERDKEMEKLNEYNKKAIELETRLKAAELAKQLSERFEKAIETRRRDLLKEIETRALSFYNRMTDQQDYDSIMIDPETYTVKVHPKGLVDYIPAKRDGGGHQTLLALAIRLAILETLRLKTFLILDEPTYGVDSENLPQLAEYIGEASKMLTQTIIVTHHNICEEEASNIIEVTKGSDGVSHASAKF